MEETITNTKPDFLLGGGKMGELIRSKDWSKTPLGTPDTWPQSLRTAVSLCIASNFPIDIIWGSHRVQIYNDGYWPITGDKHPMSMGQDFKECWLSAWPVIGQAFEEASLGQARFLENQHIFLDRYGYKEETFFTFSFSPILDESGEVGGLFHPVIELTQQTLAERRLNILRSVADTTVNARTVAEASSFLLECLKDFGQDLPFVLLYCITADGKEANLQGNIGVEKDSPLAPVKINLAVQHPHTWPLTEVIQHGKSIQVEDLGNIFGTFDCEPYPEPPHQAMIFPITLHGTERHNYLLITGVSSRRSLDEKYLSFYELLCASINNALTKAKAYEEERKKVEALAEIDRAKTVFFSNISHEFRTPLTLILSPLEELLNQKNNNFSEIEKENIETTQRNALRLLKLVNTLLDFSRLESGRVKAIFSLVDIVVFTQNLASNFRSVIEKAGLELIVIADSITQPVYVDKQMWEKIVFNLLNNAFKYTFAGKITVELSAENDFVVLKVKDTGVGIPEHELSKMFERFHRVQSVNGRTHEGTGIGLSLTKELVQMHQGTINVESKLHDGSIFTVKIPTGKKHIAEHQISENEIDSNEIFSAIYVDEIEALLETENSETSKIAGVKEENILPTILVVDDNADMRRHISSILSNSFHIISAKNGVDALHKMQETTPVLVLTDIMMPVMNGIDLLKEIKSNKITENIPVIFLTARSSEESRIEGWESGADDYLVKPFSAKELAARVGTQINLKKLQKEALDTLRQEEKKKAFLLKLSDALRPLGNSVDIEEVATKIAMDFMDADRCYYCTIEEENIIILRDAFRGNFPSVVGVYPSNSFALYKAVLNEGLPFAVDDVYTSTILDEALKEICLQFQSRSFINVPLIKNGKTVGIFSLTQSKPRKWTEAEVELTIETAERIWAAVERAKIQEALCKSEEQLRTVLEQAPLAIAITDSQGDVQFRNTMFDELWGRPAHDTEALTKIQVYDGFHLDGTPIKSEEWPGAKAVLKGEVVIDEVLEIVHLSGQKIPCSFNAGPIRSEDGKITGAVVLFRDVTAERIANLQLQESEEKYRTLFDSIDEGFNIMEVITDDKGKVVDYIFLEMNNAHETMTGLSRTALGMHIRELMPDLEEIVLERVGKVVHTGEPVRYEQYVSAWNRWFDVYTTRVGGDGSRKVASVFNNITDRKQAEEKLKESENRFRTMADASPVLIWTIDAGGLPTYYNKTFRDFIGVSVDEDISDWEKMVHPEDAKSTFDTINTAIAERHSYSLECRLLRADGQWRWVLAQGNPCMDADNEFLGFVGSSVDITERKEVEAKIKESENRFQNLVRDTTAAIAVLIGPEMKVEIVNEAWGNLIERTPDELINKPLFSIIPEVESFYSPLLTKVYLTGEPIILYDSPYAVKKEEKIIEGFLHIVYQPYRDEYENILGVMVICQDVTEVVKSRKKLEESEQKIRNLIAQAPVAMCLYKEPEHIIEIINDKMLQIWGKSSETVMNKSVFETMPDFKEQGFEELLRKVYRTGESYSADEIPINLWRNGTYEKIYINLLYEPYRESNGTIIGIVEIANDVTEQVITRKKIEESEERFRSLAETLPQLVWVTDAQGISEFTSVRWKEYTGVETGGEKEWKEIVHPNDYESINAAWVHSLTTGNLYSFEVRLKNKAGKYRWHTVKGEPVLNKENEIVKWVGAFTDIHEQKLKEEKKDEFIGIASHEMKTPLTTSKAYLQMLEVSLGENNEEASLYAKKASQSINRLSVLITELLDVSKIRLGKLNYTITTFNFNDMVDSTIENIQLISPTHSIIKSGKVFDEIRGDKDRLQQVLINLLTNAVKYSPDSKEVFVTVGQETDHIKVSVKDHGIGMSEDNLTKIFEKYHRIEEHAIQFQGLGIGLFISYEIIQRHHGKLWAESEIGKGSTFYFTLPLCQIAAA